MLPQPKLVHLCDLRVDLDRPHEMGMGRAGTRRIIPIVGGIASGRLSGRILSLGADWQTIFHDGVAELDARYAVETEDGALVEVVNRGYRHGPPEVIERLRQGKVVEPHEYYMRTTARLESGDERYAWLNRRVFVGTGARMSAAVHISLYEVL